MSNFCDYLALPMLYVSLFLYSVRFLNWDPFVICSGALYYSESVVLVMECRLFCSELVCSAVFFVLDRSYWNRQSLNHP